MFWESVLTPYLYSYRPSNTLPNLPVLLSKYSSNPPSSLSKSPQHPFPRCCASLGLPHLWKWYCSIPNSNKHVKYWNYPWLFLSFLKPWTQKSADLISCSFTVQPDWFSCLQATSAVQVPSCHLDHCSRLLSVLLSYTPMSLPSVMPLASDYHAERLQ